MLSYLCAARPEIIDAISVKHLHSDMSAPCLCNAAVMYYARQDSTNNISCYCALDATVVMYYITVTMKSKLKTPVDVTLLKAKVCLLLMIL